MTRSTRSSIRVLKPQASLRSRFKAAHHATSGLSASRSPFGAVHSQAALLLLNFFLRLLFKIRRNFLQRQRTQFCAVPGRHRCGRIPRGDKDAGLDDRLDDVLVNSLRLAPIRGIAQPLQARGPEPQRRTNATVGSSNAWDAMTDRTTGASKDQSV